LRKDKQSRKVSSKLMIISRSLSKLSQKMIPFLNPLKDLWFNI